MCPRRCGADRRTGAGYCGCGDGAAVAKTMLHIWEEPPVSGTRGSGAVFFSGCNLRCIYCQNRDISFSVAGRRMSRGELADAFLSLRDAGAHNINLVTAAPYLPDAEGALGIARRRGLDLPVVYNTGGYELPEAVEALSPYVDVWLPDFKYASAALAAKYSSAPDYPAVAEEAIDRMVRLTGPPVIENGLIRRGVIVRHLVLPGCRADSMRVVRRIAEKWGGDVKLSLMRQYTPDFAPPGCGLNRRVTTFEYNSVLEEALRLGLDGWFQDADSATKAYTPDFTNNVKS